MRSFLLLGVAVMACLTLSASSAFADANWVGGGGDDLWSNAANWDPGIPTSATERHNPPAPPNNDNNVARNKLDGTNILIEDGINAVAFGVQIGHPKEGVFGSQSASNTLTMTGGSLTTQGNFLFNVGRGTNVLPGHLVQFNMSGGTVDAAGITVPEAFSPAVGSVGINAEMHVSGDSVINTDLLRLGANDANSLVTVSDNARININDENNGFANGQLWLESFEDLDNPGGTSVLDISDHGVVAIHGGVNNEQEDQSVSLGIIVNDLIPRGMITANGGLGTVIAENRGGIIYLAAKAGAIPEPSTMALLLLSCPLLIGSRRRG